MFRLLLNKTDYNCHSVTARAVTFCSKCSVTAVCANTVTESATPLFDRLIQNVMLEFSPCLNQSLPQLDHIPDWCSVHTLLHHAQDAVIHRIRSWLLAGQTSRLMNLPNPNIWKRVSIALLKYDFFALLKVVLHCGHNTQVS